MKIGFSPESIVGLDGMPLVGRVTLFAHDSDTAINVYTLEGDTFVQAENPQLLNDAGRLGDTLFFDAAIVDVLVERYVGTEGMLSVDSPDSDFETFDRFEIGFDASATAKAETVDTIPELMDAPVENRFVTVMGYYEVGDCAPRTYVWDPDSANDIDGGYVVGSTVEDSGRWILLWGDEILPSSVYGILPGHNETNLNAFLSYPATVGSFLQKTAPCARFERGEYESAIGIATTKTLVFDKGAKFSEASFSCPGISVLGQDGYIADFVFDDPSFVAHSSWFRSVSAFWSCGTKKLVIDDENYFESLSVSSSIDIEGAVIEGTKRIPATYSNGGRLKFTGCSFVGRSILSPVADYVIISSMEFTDKFFAKVYANSWDFGQVSGGHHVQIIWASDVRMNVDDFVNPDVFAKAAVYSGAAELDMRNRELSGDLVSGQLSQIKNATMNNLVVSAAPSNVLYLTNVTVKGYVEIADDVNVIADRCILDFVPKSAAPQTIYRVGNSLTLTDCDAGLDGFSLDAHLTSLVMKGGYWSGGIGMEQAAMEAGTPHKTLSFDGVTFKYAFKITASSIVMKNCTTPAPIDLVTWKDSNPWLGHYWKLTAYLEGNTFTGDFLLDMKPAKEDLTIYNVLFDTMVIKNNRFANAGKGVRCRYWTNTILSRFLEGMYSENYGQVQFYEYEGNVGNCPAKAAGSDFFDFGDSIYFTDDDRNYYRTKAAKGSRSVFVVPTYYRGDDIVGMVDGIETMCTTLPSVRMAGISTEDKTVNMPNDEKKHFGYVPALSDENDIFDVIAICDDQYGVGMPESKTFFAVRSV